MAVKASVTRLNMFYHFQKFGPNSALHTIMVWVGAEIVRNICKVVESFVNVVGAEKDSSRKVGDVFWLRGDIKCK